MQTRLQNKRRNSSANKAIQGLDECIQIILNENKGEVAMINQQTVDEESKEQSPIDIAQNRETEQLKVNLSIGVSNFENEDDKFVGQEANLEHALNSNKPNDQWIEEINVNPVTIKEETKSYDEVVHPEPSHSETLQAQSTSPATHDDKPNSIPVYKIEDSDNFPVPEG